MGFAKATPQTLATRRIVSAAKPAMRQQFAKHISALNHQFYNWLKEQVESDPYAELKDGFQVRF